MATINKFTVPHPTSYNEILTLLMNTILCILILFLFCRLTNNGLRQRLPNTNELYEDYKAD